MYVVVMSGGGAQDGMCSCLKSVAETSGDDDDHVKLRPAAVMHHHVDDVDHGHDDIDGME
jgi:hypothetical protein